MILYTRTNSANEFEHLEKVMKFMNTPLSIKCRGFMEVELLNLAMRNFMLNSFQTFSYFNDVSRQCGYKFYYFSAYPVL